MNILSASSVRTGVAVLVLLALPITAGEARPKKDKEVMHCSCTCVAFDSAGKRHEGARFDFNTPGGDCSIGSRVGCRVGTLKGSYARCDGVPAGGMQLSPKAIDAD
jgi:hypothetical protein